MEKLFKISLILSIVGIMLLLLLSNYLQPELKKIKDINYDLIDKKVKIEGKILKIENKENLQILSIKDDTAWIDVLLNGQLNITDNQQVTVIGTVKEYKQYLQIQADKIIKQ